MELQHPKPTAKTPATAFTDDIYMTPIYSGTGPSQMTAALRWGSMPSAINARRAGR